jgi:APA family basic amino acid/polyamine antiporter
MAEDGLFFRSLARIHPRYRTPYVAIAFYTVFSLVCVATRTFEQLVEAFIVGIWPFLALAVGAVFVLRRTRPDLPRPYRTVGYPLVPIVFLLGTLGVVASALVERPASTLVSLGITLLGIPVYAGWKAAAGRARAARVTGESP